jgi:hypothetical protein
MSKSASVALRMRLQRVGRAAPTLRLLGLHPAQLVQFNPRVRLEHSIGQRRDRCTERHPRGSGMGVYAKARQGCQLAPLQRRNSRFPFSLPVSPVMKKRRPTRPKRKAPRPVEGKGKTGDLSSSLPSAQRSVSADAPPPQAQLAQQLSRSKEPPRAEPVAPMTNARGWTIFAGLIISFLLVAAAVVLFATYYGEH